VTMCHSVFSPEDLAEKADKYQNLSISASLFRVRCCFGTPGYAISPLGAAKLRQMLLPVRNFTLNSLLFSAENRGIDVALISMYEKLNAYLCLPPLLLTPNDHKLSTIRESPLAS
jgi:glycosyl transferase family 25